MSYPRDSMGIRLPQSLLEQIGRSEDHAHHAHLSNYSRHESFFSRKNARKQERLAQKQRKAGYFSTTFVNSQRGVESEHRESPVRKKRKISPKLHEPSGHLSLSGDIESHKGPFGNPDPSDKALSQKVRFKSNSREEQVSKGSSKLSFRTPQDMEDDAYIAHLELKLGYKGGRKKVSKATDNDGLNDILYLATSLIPSYTKDSGSSEQQGDSSDSIKASREGLLTGAEDEHVFAAEEEWNGFDNGSDAEVKNELASRHVSDVPPLTATHYVPPHLRTAKAGQAEEMPKLIRQLTGLLNRMSEQNIASVLDNVEEIYRKHRRHHITATLTSLIIDRISSHSIHLDSYVVLHAAFISSLHKLIGVEFAAYFLQNLVSSYESHRKTVGQNLPAEVADSLDERGKECSNLIVLMSELYNFQFTSCILVYDVIRDLLNHELSEFDVELLLKILRNSGQQLRQDDPYALKDIINITQDKLASKMDSISSRTRFMVETLNNLKNNRSKKVAAQHQGGEAVDRLKKFLSGLNKQRHVIAHEPLRVSLDDLRSSESKGKWWLVGAAWGGDPLVDRQQGILNQAKFEINESGNNALLKLARKQGMNTEIRRSIFVVLMSSNDYADACERLTQLNLTEVQQREIVKVSLHCCGNEKNYNPYYTLICQYLCQRSYSYKVTMQFCLWDFLRDLGETKVGGAEVIKNIQEDDGRFAVKKITPMRMRNMAKAYAWWIAKDCCSLIILKPIDFAQLKTRTREFLTELFTQIFIATQCSSPMLSGDIRYLSTRNRTAIEEIFVKVSRIENFGPGLDHFLTQTFRSGDNSLKWALAVAKETLQTGLDAVPNF